MHLFCINKFYHIPYEMDGDKKYFYRKCEMTKNCSYLAFFLEREFIFFINLKISKILAN